VAGGAAVEWSGAAEWKPGAPYPGLRPFRQTDQDRFFGRGAESKALTSFWHDNRIVLVTGPAACGKTSLLHAGVLPLLKQSQVHLLPPGRIACGAAFPNAALPKHNPYTFALLRSWSPDEAPTDLVTLTVRDFVKARAQRHQGPLYAAIDEVDPLSAASSLRRHYSERFLAELDDAVAAEPRLRLLILSRDCEAELIASRIHRAARFELTALTQLNAIQAAAGPAVGAGWSFTEEAIEKLVAGLQTSRIVSSDGSERHVRSEQVEPVLLQAVCVRLWNLLPPDTERVTTRDVRQFGSADRALASYCGQIIAAVADEFDRSSEWVRGWLLRTFITDFGTRSTAYAGVTETAGAPNEIVQALADRHLLRAETRSGSRWYELLADRLIQPLRDTVDALPAAVAPTRYLAVAERALAQGELDVAQRYARLTLDRSAGTDLRLRAETESLLGNIEAERDETAAAKAAAEGHHRTSARLFEILHDLSAVASQLSAVGQMLLIQDRLEEALEESRAAVNRMPSDPVIQTNLALVLWRLGDSPAALTVLTRVLSLDGGNTMALGARGEILADIGDARQAMLDLDRVPLQERPAARAARGLALAILGDRSKASKEIDEAIAEAPWNGDVLLRAARVRALNGDESVAEELARRAIDATDPALPPYHREMALQLARREHGSSLAS
jgi:tetratricopeptide (TPR) repeat protein